MACHEPSRFRYVFGKRPVGDNFVFFLCYRWTVLILLAFSLVITSKLLLGYSFTCTDSYTTSQFRLNAICYESVYSLPVEAEPSHHEEDESPLRRYQTHYPWVNLLFLVQAFLFYLPHLLWKSYEKGYLGKLTFGLQKFFGKGEKRGLELCYLAKYVTVTQGQHKIYTFLYVFLELSNFVFALTQKLWLPSFFNVTGTQNVSSVSGDAWADFRNFYFPFEARCQYRTMGSSGDMQRHDARCLLPLNHLYMIMFLFLQAWYLFVAVLCGLVLLYRVSLLVPSLRVRILRWMAPLAQESVLNALCHRLSYSDYFFLTRLQRAMIDVDFARMVDKISLVSQGKSFALENHGDLIATFFEDGQKELINPAATSSL